MNGECPHKARWKLKDGREKCKDKNCRKVLRKERSLWGDSHLPTETKSDLLRRFLANDNETAGQAARSGTASLPTTAKFFHSLRKCCASDSGITAATLVVIYRNGYGDFSQISLDAAPNRAKSRGPRFVLIALEWQERTCSIRAVELTVRKRNAVIGAVQGANENGHHLPPIKIVTIKGGNETRLQIAHMQWTRGFQRFVVPRAVRTDGNLDAQVQVYEFWRYAIDRLLKYRSVPCNRLYFYIGEMLWRYNNRGNRFAGKTLEKLMKTPRGKRLN